MKKLFLIILVVSIAFMNPIFYYLPSVNADAPEKTLDGFSDFSTLSDPDLLRYVEDSVYLNLVRNLNSEDYFVEKVEAVYISKEFLEEVAFNSQSNIFFGYTLAELDERFQGKRYVFTLGEDGTTIVKEFEGYDDTYEKVIQNVAIGSGVILLCVTVSVVSGGLGAPAISAIFAASAKTGAEFALGSGIFSGISSGVITGIQTGDFNEAIQAAALNGSESFKWGAISGAATGGLNEFTTLQSMTKNGLSMNDAAIIQKESNLPTDVIRTFRNMDEYEIYKKAGLQPEMINNKYALVRSDINCCSVTDGKTNLERMRNGNAALDPSGNPYELHHIAQNNDSFLAVLTNEEHHLPGLHINEASRIDRVEFKAIREGFWMAYSIFMSGNGSCAACPIR